MAVTRESYPGSIILRTLGRQYADEPHPRWSLGLYLRRDGRTLADGLPVDPLSEPCPCEKQGMIAFWQSLAGRLNRNGRAAISFQIDVEMGLRILFATHTKTISANPAADPRLMRAPVQSQVIPPEGLEDDLAAHGLYLVAIGCMPGGPENSLQPCIELPGFGDVELFADFVHRVAIAAMLRALAVMLARQDSHPALIDWGSRLHDRFALPFYLLQDLHTVFNDLQCAGLGLGEPITRRLCADHWRHVGDAELAGCRLDVDLAIEFWPLLGDATEQVGGSRLVDASTQRLQLTLRPCGDQDADLDGWRLLVGNYRVPLRREQDDTGVVLITGLRYRAFVPWAGLHPGLGAQTPIVLCLLPPGGEKALRCTLYDWQPEGRPYDGLPDTLDEARRRIAERFVVEEISPDQVPDTVNPPDEAVSDYCLDLRRTWAKRSVI